ncbi:MAG: alpha-ketoglutarate-dependent dioxygenase AlkB [Chitinophagaceae bacterium]|nr:MAG: alpha-ketoglutarate-dependent dioxygenase AlkB [Chitinophagaceae bacterium]
MVNPKNPDHANLLPHHGEAYLYNIFFSVQEADNMMRSLRDELPWKQEPVRIFGKELMQPRLTCWCADPGVSYSYSGITMHGEPWNPVLTVIKERVEKIAGVRFNGALLNYYRSGQDSMGWHRDNEKELGGNPVIGSVSFGGTRKFRFRDYSSKKEIIPVDLAHGSFLLMKGLTQHYWEHQLPKTTKNNLPRINITFRCLKNI